MRDSKSSDTSEAGGYGAAGQQNAEQKKQVIVTSKNMLHTEHKKCPVRSTRTFELLSVEIYSVVARVQNAFENRLPLAVVQADILAMTETQFFNQYGADVNRGTSLDRELSPERYGVGNIKTRGDLRQTKIVIVAAHFGNFTRNGVD